MPYRRQDDRRAWWARNRDRYNALRRVAYAKNPGPSISQAREGRLKSVYGLARGDYAALLYQQDGGCAICGCPPRGESHVSKTLHVDHDHDTGLVRGLLCNACNHAIGHLRDDAALCRRAAEYLERHGARPKPPEGSEQAIETTRSLFDG